LREEKKHRQRRALIDTAVALFRERGFEQTRVQDVTERLHISEATFFNYFPTKQSVLEAAAVDILDKATAELYHDVDGDTRPVPERLEQLVRAFADNFAGDRQFATLLALHTQLWNDQSRQQQVFLLLGRLFEEGQRREEIRNDVPPRQLAELYLAFMWVTISNWVAAAGAEPLAKPLLRTWRVVRDGMVTGTPPKPAAGAKRSKTRR
jgi:NADH dehydrogenase